MFDTLLTSCEWAWRMLAQVNSPSLSSTSQIQTDLSRLQDAMKFPRRWKTGFFFHVGKQDFIFTVAVARAKCYLGSSCCLTSWVVHRDLSILWGRVISALLYVYLFPFQQSGQPKIKNWIQLGSIRSDHAVRWRVSQMKNVSHWNLKTFFHK